MEKSEIFAGVVGMQLSKIRLVSLINYGKIGFQTRCVFFKLLYFRAPPFKLEW
jgi:hypothetical protein